jgi:hypothetical protein
VAIVCPYADETGIVAAAALKEIAGVGGAEVSERLDGDQVSVATLQLLRVLKETADPSGHQVVSQCRAELPTGS